MLLISVANSFNNGVKCDIYSLFCIGQLPRDITFITAGGPPKTVDGGPQNFTTLFFWGGGGPKNIGINFRGGHKKKFYGKKKMDNYLSAAQKNVATTPLFFTIYNIVVLEVREHILSAIVMSTKSVITTDNVVMFCVSEVVPTRLWGVAKKCSIGGGHKIWLLEFAQFF